MIEGLVVEKKRGGEAKHMYTTPHPRLYRQRERNRPRKRKREVLLERDERRLESEEQQKRHHETKETHGLGKGETQNGVGEKLLFEGRVPRVADDEGAEHGADTGAGSGHAHCSSTRTDVLGRRIDIHGPRGCLERANWDNAER